MSAIHNPIPMVPHRAPPSGTITFAFTDIAGSTVRWDRDRAAMEDAVRRHDAIMRAAIAAHDGYVFKTIGDAFCAAFSRPQDAVAAMLEAQRALAAQDFTAVDGIRVRMAIHTGTADERDGDYYGPAVNRVARLLGIAHGGQMLLSDVTSALITGSLPAGADLRDLGLHRLRDLTQAEHVRQLLAPDLPAEFPPLCSLDTLANNLPLQVTSFVGRETEIAEIAALLGKHRLVTLVGAGGVGKTRASLHVAASGVDGSGDGVWFVELAPLANGDYIPSTTAQAIGLTLGAGDPIAALVAALKSKNMLLVFDNCEHLVDAAARTVSALIRGCPQITILASSRQALGIAGEATYRMPSLPLPPAMSEVTAERAQDYAAIALFVERACAVNNRFELTDENAPVIADICRRLDGIALAIELAAARVKVMAPRQLRDRLDERFKMLTGGSRDLLPRQQTLRALVDWSYDLLDEREQMVFRRLGVFADGFTLEAASAVGGGDDLDEFETIDVITSLVEKSLVTAETQGESSRYRLLESTRVYAAEKLNAAGEREPIARRHLRYLRDVFVHLEHEAQQLRGANRMIVFATELDDLRSALDGARDRGDFVDGANLLAFIGNVWLTIGIAPEGIARIEAAMAAVPQSQTTLLARLSTVLCSLLANAGLMAKGIEVGSALTSFARAAGDGQILGDALCQYAFALLAAGDYRAADVPLREAQAIEGLSPRLRLSLLQYRALLSTSTGDFDAAARILGQVIEQWRSVGDKGNEALSMQQLANVEFERSAYHRAIDLMHRSIALQRQVGSSGNLGFFLCTLGSMLALDGEFDAAIPPAIEAIMIWASRDPRHMDATLTMELLAYITAANGDLVRAARLTAYTDAARARMGLNHDGIARAVYDRLAALLREQLTPDDLARLTAEGAALSPKDAIALACLIEGTPQPTSS